MKKCVQCGRVSAVSSDCCPYCGCKAVLSPSDGLLLPEGTIIAERYLIGSEAFCGGSSVVYKSSDTVSGRTVAVKEFLVSRLMKREEDNRLVCSDADNTDEIGFRRERFLREARILSRAGACRGVPEVHDCFHENGTVYIVSRWIEGKSLADFISEGKYSVNEVKVFSECFLDTLNRIHGKSIVHRDLSPDNIILKDGNVSEPYIIDFGESVCDGVFNADKVRILKAGYSSPEERMGRNISERSDIWSAASVILTMICRKKTNDYITFCGIQDSSVPDTYPPAFRNALKIALSPDPGKRFSTAADFAKAAGLQFNVQKKGRSVRTYEPDPCPGIISDVLPDTPELSPGTMISGRYLISREWTKCGSCYVYKAYDRRLGRNVSLTEVFNSGLCFRDRDGTGVRAFEGYEYDFSNLLDVFEKEAGKICRCSPGRGLCVTERFFRENGTAYSVSEYIPAVRFPMKINPHSVIEKMKPVYQSLSELHDNGGMHGNISYTNLRMREDGSLCLCNPGSVYIPPSPGSMRGRRQSGILSPDRLSGELSPDEKSDDYLLAVLLYRLICGHDPASPGERIEAERLGREDPLIPVRKKCRWINENQSEIIMRVLNTRMNGRETLSGLFD